MSETKVVGPEARRRVRRSILTFFGLSAPGVVGSIAVELRDPNAFSFSQSVMNVYDGIIAGGMLMSEKLDAHGYHKSAQLGRTALCIGHIGVAGAGTITTFDRLQSPESASVTSLGVSLGVAALSGVAIAYERHRDKSSETSKVASDRYHELGGKMARRLFHTKVGEAGFTAAGICAQLATTAEHPTTGIAAVAAAGTVVSVSIPMLAQVRQEWQHHQEFGGNEPDELAENLAT
jgi:hypothetical protein